jgi:hypothetical protein
LQCRIERERRKYSVLRAASRFGKLARMIG